MGRSDQQLIAIRIVPWNLPGSWQLPGRFYRASSLVAKDGGKGKLWRGVRQKGSECFNFIHFQCQIGHLRSGLDRLGILEPDP